MSKLLLISLFFFFFSAITNINSDAKKEKEKLSHFRFYWHDTLGGRNPTAVNIARASTTNSSAAMFGLLRMIDDPLTVGPTMASGLIGRAQGLYGMAALDTTGLIMAMNLVFTGGKYNGSTLTIMGRNRVRDRVREMPVIGGSGTFRFARGYVEARTYKFNQKSGDAVVHYDCYVMHY